MKIQNIDSHPGDRYYQIAYGLKPGDVINVIGEKDFHTHKKITKGELKTKWYFITVKYINPILAGNWLGRTGIVRIEASKCDTLHS